MTDSGDTIAAVSTAAGASPRGIVRWSGPQALALLRKLLPPSSAPPRSSPLRSTRADDGPGENYRAFSADIVLKGFCVPARVYVMRAPTSYTREDVVEVHTFGNPSLLAAVLEEVMRLGARPAGPGEFTRRAFLNGRIDLAQAEAVEAVIHARNEGEYRAALGALSGHVSRRVGEFRDCLVDLLASVEASLDFSDQDIEVISWEEVVQRFRPLRDRLEATLAMRREGRVSRQSVRVVLFGPANAGKSSLLNAMLKKRRAIVSPHPGTTRDTIEATLALDGLELALVDTAGLRPPADEVEALAVTRSRDSIRRADLGLCVLDSACAPSAEALEAVRGLAPESALILLNKCDLGPCHPALKEALPHGVEILAVSAATGAGVKRVLDRIRERIEAGSVERGPGDLMVSARQLGLLRTALGAVERVLRSGDAHSMDLVASDLREALEALSAITGDSVTEDILDHIFAHFCVGK